MNNENLHPNRRTSSNQDGQAGVHHKLATLLAVLVSFQEKIEILRVKLAGHPNFSPQLYYKQIDRCEKGYISSQDFVTFIKKSKPQFNIDVRYLNSLFMRLNQDDRVPSDRLTYFGYLNIVKPYFETSLARDLLTRDSIAMGVEVNIVTKKLLEELICTLYVCVAQHEAVKELIILGDIEQGGNKTGTLFNIYELLKIVQESGRSEQTQLVNGRTEQEIAIISNPNIGSLPSEHSLRIPTVNNIRTSSTISLSRQSNANSTLTIFHNFIVRHSDYEIERDDMKYLLAYLVCHEYMLTQEKYLTLLFMPVSANVQISHSNNIHKEQTQNKSTQINFLNYVHPNSMTKQGLNDYRNSVRKSKPNIPKAPQNPNPEIRVHNPSSVTNLRKVEQQQKLIDQQPRMLLNVHESSISTPVLQKFLRQSKILKNMSRYQHDPQYDRIQELGSAQSSAFIQQSRYQHSRNLKPTEDNRFLNPNRIAKQHEPKEVRKDFNLQDVLNNNSNMQRSEYYHNLSMRAQIKDEPLQPHELVSPNRNLGGGGVLDQFMLL